MAKQIIIFGTGGNCIDILDLILEINATRRTTLYECLGFLDDNEQNWGREIFGYKVLGPLSSAPSFIGCSFVNGIGSSNTFWQKASIIAKSAVSLDQFETLIHPTASVSQFARLGRGTVIFQNVTVTSNVTIGNHVIVLPNSVISHDCIILDYTCVAGGVCISGGVEVGASCYLGTNSSIIERVKIGKQSLIGMGTVVRKDVPDNSVIVGNPARHLRKVVDTTR